MKNFTYLIPLLIAFFSCRSNKEESSKATLEKTSTITLPQYSPANQALYDTIVALDKIYNEAYNTQNDSIITNIVTEDFEYYHDRGGTTFGKERFTDLVERGNKDRRKNGRKVFTRTVKGSIEVYEIPDYGVIQLSYRQFNHENDEEWSIPSRAITFWKKTPEGWLQSKRVSLHVTSGDKN